MTQSMFARSSSQTICSWHGAGILLLTSLLVACAPAPTATDAVAAPPSTRTDDAVEELHGMEIADPYRWLEDQESSETRAWIEAQNAYTDRLLGDLPGREALEARFKALFEIEQVGAPEAAGDRYFFTKRGADQDLAVLYMRQGLDGEDEVLIDPHPMSDDRTTSVGFQDVTKDGSLLAYGVREGGQDELSIRFFDVDTRADRGSVLPKGRYQGVEISPDSKVAYYSLLTEAGPRVFRHAMGSDPAKDQVVFGEGLDIGKIIGITLSDDGRHLLAHVFYGSSGDKVDIYLADLGGDGAFVPVVEGTEAGFFASFAGEHLIVRTTWEAPNGRVLRADLARPGIDRWQEIVAESETAVLRSVSPAGGKLFASYLEDVKSRVAIFDIDGGSLGEIAFDTIGTVTGVNGDWHTNEAFFAFSSFHVPTTTYRYDTADGTRSEWARPDVPVDSDRFIVEQVWYASQDGTRVPMFTLRAKDSPQDGERPVYLTGYGGFNVSRTPFFSSSGVVWAENGGVFAVANLRGGGEFGEAWHRAGMLENKQNVFDDFIAAAEHLVDSGWTRPEKLSIRGGSNGGLLVATVANQRPDLFAAVICGYPLLDMLRYHRFMVARYWVPEYGSAEDEKLFPVLRGYSPYHNIRSGADYPAMLFVTGDGDTRVAPLHARKMAARMQAEASAHRPILLRYHIKAGHSGGRPVSQQVDDSVEAFAFLWSELGVSG